MIQAIFSIWLCRASSWCFIIDYRATWAVITQCKRCCRLHNQRPIYAEEVINMNYTYILTCSDGTLYCGWTNDLDKRLKAHNEGQGAKYTKPRRPVVLSYYEAYETKSEAMKREYAIKHLSRAEKEKLIQSRP